MAQNKFSTWSTSTKQIQELPGLNALTQFEKTKEEQTSWTSSLQVCSVQVITVILGNSKQLTTNTDKCKKIDEIKK